jgi:hypothetical protein
MGLEKENQKKWCWFCQLSQYVIDNEILRPDLVVKSTGIKSAIKLYIIKM